VVRTSTGDDTDDMKLTTWDVKDLAGKTATIEIVDASTDGWGHIEVDEIRLGN
jgi:hypothetical protein